jgi:hypothetical protein
MRKKTLTDRSIAALKPRVERYAVPDPGQPNHYVRVMPGGTKSYVVVAPDPHSRRQIWATIGGTDHLSLSEARHGLAPPGRSNSAPPRRSSSLIHCVVAKMM